MKRAIAIILISILAISLFGCGPQQKYGEYAELIELIELGKYNAAKEWIDDMYNSGSKNEGASSGKNEPSSSTNIMHPGDDIPPSSSIDENNPEDTKPEQTKPEGTDPEDSKPEQSEKDTVLQIYTAAELFSIVPDKEMTYILEADIDLTGYTSTIPELQGVLDGNGHTLLNATAPLILCNNGTINNLYMKDCQIHMTESAAAIAVENNGTIFGCTVSGSITAEALDAYAGGIAATNQGIIDKCVNYAEVLANSFGRNEIGNIIHGTWATAGGICAWNRGEVRRCHNAGYVYGAGAEYISSSGGIVAMNHNFISDCWNAGTIDAAGESGFSNAGGIAAYNEGDRIIYCYNIGQVAAGLVSDNRQYLIDCYYLDSASRRGGSDNTWERIQSFSQSQIADASVFAGFDFETIWIITDSGPQLR